ncbi:uncharacterized protein LOC126887738 [Diabrotica virgifera virgifera]|uniref:HAT C-terminal dimerisation domain-containing protein n=1 Tax=Diabrotica virgifera virgifera TaxID=50390 RepID=A0ABM5KML6_DIAVI|nr:uncharacterized protein LOC126887738 [Diabrotica virgifera virgifera]
MNSEWHRQASENSSNFISVMKNEKKNVECLANYGLAKQIESNRAKLKSIVSSILFSALHDLPLRGHTNEDAVFNNLLHFRKEAGDSVLEDHLKNACFLPSVAKAIQIALCLPPTTCTIERSFSTLKRVKTWIRNTMSNNRLRGLCLLSVHRRKIKENKENFMQKVIDLFAMDTRRIQLLFK